MIYAFILSAPRSGSTLLRLTLNKMPGVIALPETNFFAFIDQHKIKKEFSSASEKNNSIKKWVRHHSIKKWNVNQLNLKNTWKDVLPMHLIFFCKPFLFI